MREVQARARVDGFDGDGDVRGMRGVWPLPGVSVRGVAGGHPAARGRVVVEVDGEPTALAQVAVDRGEPAGQALRVGHRRPEVGGVGVVDAVEGRLGVVAGAAEGSEQGVGVHGCSLVSMLVSLAAAVARRPRAISVSRASSGCVQNRRTSAHHCSTSPRTPGFRE